MGTCVPLDHAWNMPLSHPYEVDFNFMSLDKHTVTWVLYSIKGLTNNSNFKFIKIKLHRSKISHVQNLKFTSIIEHSSTMQEILTLTQF